MDVQYVNGVGGLIMEDENVNECILCNDLQEPQQIYTISSPTH